MLNKQISMAAAIQLVPSGCTLAMGGMTIYRRPMAFARALVQHARQVHAPTDLTLLAFTAGPESDLLVGAGIVSRVRTCYFGLEIFGLAPMFTYRANRGEIPIIEESEASLVLGLRARQARIGFMPGRAWLGTDMPRLRPDVLTIVAISGVTPMPKAHSRPNNPVSMAESVLALLDQVPGARTVFLRHKRASQTLSIESYKTSDPEPDKLRKTAGYYEVGTFSRGIATSDLVADILETMGKIR